MPFFLETWQADIFSVKRLIADGDTHFLQP